MVPGLWLNGRNRRGVIQWMPYRILCNGTLQKSQEARSGLGLASSHCTSLHNNRYGIQRVPLRGPNSSLVQYGFSQTKEGRKTLCPRRKMFAPSSHLQMFLNCRYAAASVWSSRQEMSQLRSTGYARQSRPVFNKPG